MSRKTLQQLIRDTPPGGELILHPSRGEHEGPVTLDRPIVLVGNGGTIWSRRGPVLRIESPGVLLRDLSVEVTTYEELAERRDRVCLLIGPGARDARLENVAVRGGVEGMPGEEEEWDYPRTLRLSGIEAGQTTSYAIRMVAGRRFQAKSLVAGVQVEPSQGEAGLVELKIRVEALRPDTLLRGSILLETEGLARRMELVGRAVAPESGCPIVADGSVIFSSREWAGTEVTQAASTAPAYPPVGALSPEELGNWQRVIRDPFQGPFPEPLPYDYEGVDPQTYGLGPAISYTRPLIEQ